MIRSLIFKFFFYLGIISICIVFLPALALPTRLVLFGGKIMGHWSKICLNIFLSTKILIKGRENLVSDSKFFIACSHQSMFETFFLQTIFNSPVFILKKELLQIPIFGNYLKKIGSISIDRDKISKENLIFSDKIKSVVNSSSRPIIIFPQATRMSSDDRSPFKKGVSRIYDDLKIKCQPVAINSGKIWPKSGKLNSNKTLVVSILEPIEPGMESKDFLNCLQSNIYNELDIIN
tara:strand:+ start:35 stop:736 length:702 start_codon:yes stop_codon:yes gene_type:complete